MRRRAERDDPEVGGALPARHGVTPGTTEDPSPQAVEAATRPPPPPRARRRLRRPRRRAERRDWRPSAVRLLSVAALLVAWEIYGRQQETTLFFVPLTTVLVALWDLLGTAEFWGAYRDTLIPFVWGWMLALAVGVVAGLLVGRSVTIALLSTPYLTFLNALPVSTLVPVAVILFGIGIESRVLIVFLFAVVEVTMNTATGVRYVGQDLIEMGRSFGANQWRLFRRIILPGSLPGIMAGVRIGTGRAVVGMVVVELLLVSVGVGELMNRYRGRFQSANLYAMVFSLAVFGIVLLALVRALERRTSRWRGEAAAGG